MKLKLQTGTYCSHLYFKFGNTYLQAATQECIISENYKNNPATISKYETDYHIVNSA